TSNVQHQMKKQTPNTEHSTAISVSSSFPIQRSMLDVRCSMFIFSILLGQKQLSVYAPPAPPAP
ncbi:MAG: hypothetical protein KAU38_13550, partial [Desulfobacterales bacterium]|nr:hypothetical protein [Desulfobacterales bacterium]